MNSKRRRCSPAVRGRSQPAKRRSWCVPPVVGSGRGSRLAKHVAEQHQSLARLRKERGREGNGLKKAVAREKHNGASDGHRQSLLPGRNQTRKETSGERRGQRDEEGHVHNATFHLALFKRSQLALFSRSAPPAGFL